MSIVYAIHEPTRFDRKEREAVAMDLSRAGEHGELKVLFPGIGVKAPRGERFIEGVRPALEVFAPDDFLLMAGDFELVVWAAILIERWTGETPRLLKWNAREDRYVVVTMPTSEKYVPVTTSDGTVTYAPYPGGLRAHAKEIIRK